MNINSYVENNALIIQITGCIDGNTAPAAQEKILSLVAGGTNVVLDLKECNYISSAGLRILLMVAKSISSQNGKLVFAGLLDDVKEVMDITGFGNFFTVYENVQKAVDAVKTA